jgi:hypothetical protein
MEIIRYTSKDDIRHFMERDINLMELLRNTSISPQEANEDIDGNIKEKEYQFVIPIKITIEE